MTKPMLIAAFCLGLLSLIVQTAIFGGYDARLSGFTIAMWVAVIVVLLIPPRYDPAILLREWLEKRRRP